MKPISLGYGTFAIVSPEGGLRLIDIPQVYCHGYQNCCVCPDCLLREAGPLPAQQEPAQPWEPRAA